MAYIIHGVEYPAERIEKIWKEVLLLQFHDILPGSSIKRVYDESKARYAEMLKEIDSLTAFSARLSCEGRDRPGSLQLALLAAQGMD